MPLQSLAFSQLCGAVGWLLGPIAIAHAALLTNTLIAINLIISPP